MKRSSFILLIFGALGVGALLAFAIWVDYFDGSKVLWPPDPAAETGSGIGGDSSIVRIESIGHDDRLEVKLHGLPNSASLGETILLELEFTLADGIYLVAPEGGAAGFTGIQVGFFQTDGLNIEVGPWPSARSVDPVAEEPLAEDEVIVDDQVQVYSGTIRVPVRVLTPTILDENHSRPYARGVIEYQTFGRAEPVRSSAKTIQFGFRLRE